MAISFEWDPKKDKTNRTKHKVSFGEAMTVFLDERALLIADPDHSHAEERFILIGMSERARVLVVCHCYRRSEEIIRIFSARKATSRESGRYFERW
jgi:uncharacterized protein